MCGLDKIVEEDTELTVIDKTESYSVKTLNRFWNEANALANKCNTNTYQWDYETLAKLKKGTLAYEAVKRKNFIRDRIMQETNSYFHQLEDIAFKLGWDERADHDYTMRLDSAIAFSRGTVNLKDAEPVDPLDVMANPHLYNIGPAFHAEKKKVVK